MLLWQSPPLVNCEKYNRQFQEMEAGRSYPSNQKLYAIIFMEFSINMTGHYLYKFGFLWYTKLTKNDEVLKMKEIPVCCYSMPEIMK